MNQSVALNALNTPMSPVVQLGCIETLESELMDRWLDVSQAEYRFLSLLREFDFRQGWKAYGCNDCAEWMDFKLKITRKTALEKVRVAKALWFVPKIDAAFKEGTLSYSQVRAITRIADPSNEEELLEEARLTSACGLEKLVQRRRHGDERASAQMARSQQNSRALHLFMDSGELMVKLPPDQLALIQQAVEMLVETLPEDPERDYFASRADALVLMAIMSLSGERPECAAARTTRATDGGEAKRMTGSVPENTAGEQKTSQPPTPTSAHQILVHVDATALSGQGGESDYPLPTMKRLCCSGSLTPILKSGSEVLDVGRKFRVVTPKLNKALAARDRHCQFPGCHHTQFLDAHHIKHWCDGGETKLDNLLVLCTHHHTAMHEGGFSLQDRGGQLYFTRPDGRPVDILSSAEDRAVSRVRA